MNERKDGTQEGHIGRTDESAVDTIPGGVRRGDERVAATQSESSGEGAEDQRVEGGDDEWPSGHRRGDHVSDDDVREAGASR